MRQAHRHSPKAKQPPRPLNAARLEEMALAYVARFATSAHKLHDYLRRKLRERGWEGDGEAPLDSLVERFVAAGYVNDEMFARARTGSLLRRGYGKRRIAQALGQAGIEEDLRASLAPELQEQRQAALAFARKRRLGPYAASVPDRPTREKHMAAMLRAGHPMDIARNLLNAPTIEAAEEWAAADEDLR